MALSSIIDKIRNFSIAETVENTKRLFRDTAAEVFVVGALGLTLGTLFSYNHEVNRTKKIPLGFSEISEVEKISQRNGVAVPPVTHYLTTTNDLVMKIFECWNDANDFIFSTNTEERFADRLYDRMDPAAKIFRYNLKDLIELVPQRVGEARQALKELNNVRHQLEYVNEAFASAWNYWSVDVYRTETYTDSDGKTQTRQVYDHTIHHYDYDRESGERASKFINSLVNSFPQLSPPESLQVARKTNAEGEYAAMKSRDTEDKLARLNEVQLLEIANTWASGSTYQNNYQGILSTWPELNPDAASWDNAKNTARSTTYITYSRFDSGPLEYQVAQKALQDGRRITDLAGEIFGGIDFTTEETQKIPKMIDDLVQIELHSAEGSGKKLTKKILNTAIETYTRNFNHGFDVDRFRGYMLALWGFVGLAIGAGIGFGLDKAGQNFDWYRDVKTNFGSKRFDYDYYR